MRKRLLISLLLMLPIMSACSMVKPYEMEHLADPIMVSPHEVREGIRELKWLEAREGSTGGAGGAGGGCACK